MGDGGKGSTPRPFSVDQTTFASNWELAFGKRDPKVIEDAQLEDEAFELINKQKEINETTVDRKVQTR